MLVLGSGVGDQSGGTGLFYCMERCYKPTVGCAVQGRPPALLPPPSEDTPLLFPGKGMGARETSWVLPPPPSAGVPVSLSQHGGAKAGHSILFPCPELLRAVGAVRGWHPQVSL